jgi:hypothetical protein
MEQVLPPQTAHGAGFEAPRVRQFTVFLDNRVGRLQTLARELENAGVRIRAFCIEESADSALVRLICSNSDEARNTLHTAGFAFGESELIAVKLKKGTQQPLIAVCSALLAAEINIHYAYPFLETGPAIALYVDDPVLASQLLIKKGFTLLAESDMRP